VTLFHGTTERAWDQIQECGFFAPGMDSAVFFARDLRECLTYGHPVILAVEYVPGTFGPDDPFSWQVKALGEVHLEDFFTYRMSMADVMYRLEIEFRDSDVQKKYPEMHGEWALKKAQHVRPIGGAPILPPPEST